MYEWRAKHIEGVVLSEAHSGTVKANNIKVAYAKALSLYMIAIRPTDKTTTIAIEVKHKPVVSE